MTKRRLRSGGLTASLVTEFKHPNRFNSIAQAGGTADASLGRHLAQAIDYANRGIGVVPLWADRDNGTCPSTDEVAVRNAWEKHPGSPVLLEVMGTLLLAPEPGSLKDGPEYGLPAGPILTNMCDIAPKPIRWLWPGRIALGKLTLLAGDPGLGKSLITLDMAARISAGLPWPDSPLDDNPSAEVILISAEDDPADTIRPRLDAAGADVSRVLILEGVCSVDEKTGESLRRPFSLVGGMGELETALVRTGARLLVIDPISAFVGDTESHNNTQVRALLHPLSEIASKHGTAILAVTHLNKCPNAPAVYRAMGSLAFIAAARAAWGVVKDKADPARRLVLPLKNNLAGDVYGLAYRIEVEDSAPYVAWEDDPVVVSIEDAFSNETQRPRDDAVDWIKGELADGPRPASEILERADAEGLSERTLKRAKKKLGVESKQIDRVWHWFLR